MSIHIPGGSSTSSSTRRAQFIVTSTGGVLVQVYAHSDTTHSTLLGSSATNVSSGSTACGGVSGPRTCTISIPAPVGADDFVFTTYDQPPSNGSFTGANVLASGTVFNQTIIAGQANVVNVTLGGVITSLQALPVQYSQIADFGAQHYILQLTPFDADHNIMIGTLNANVTISLQEHGGSNLTSLELGGFAGPGSSSVTVSSTSQTIYVLYAGGGTPGYYATFTGSATGIPTNSSLADFSPFYLSTTSSFTPATATLPGTLNLTSIGQIATFNLQEAQYSGTFGVSGNCAGIVTVSQPAAGSTSTSTVTANGSGGTCQATYYDGVIAYPITINAPGSTTSVLQIPGYALAYFPQGAAGVKITSANGLFVGNIGTSSSADYIAMDDAGDVWVETNPPSDHSSAGVIKKYSPTGSGYPDPYGPTSATYTLTNPNGLLFSEASGAGELVAVEYNFTTFAVTLDIWDPGVTGAPSRTITHPAINPNNNPVFLVVAHNGTIYTTRDYACSTNMCLAYDVIPAGTATPSRTINESLVSQAQQGQFSPNYGVVGSDGTLYVTEFSFGSGDPLAGLYVYPVSGQEKYTLAGAYNPQGVDLDLAGNIYVVNNNSYYDQTPSTLDSAGYVTVFASDATTQLRHIGGLSGAYPITVIANGVTFESTFPTSSQNGLGAVFTSAQGATTVTQLSTAAANDIISYNNTTEVTSHGRKAQSFNGTASAHGMGGRLRFLHP
jgi:hypothetical protein